MDGRRGMKDEWMGGGGMKDGDREYEGQMNGRRGYGG